MNLFDTLPIELVDCVLQDFKPDDNLSLVCTRFYNRLHSSKRLFSYFIHHFDFDERDLEGVNLFDLFRKIRRNKGQLTDLLFEVSPLLWASHTNINSLDGKLTLVQAKKLYYTITNNKLNEHQIRTIFRAYNHNFADRHDEQTTNRLFLAFNRHYNDSSEKDFITAMTCNNFELFPKYLNFGEFVCTMRLYGYRMTKKEYYYCKNTLRSPYGVLQRENLYRFLEPELLTEIFDEEGLTLDKKIKLAQRYFLLFRVKDEEKFTLITYLQNARNDGKIEYRLNKLAKFNDVEY